LKKTHQIDSKAYTITRRIVWDHLKAFGKIMKTEKGISDKFSEINMENRIKIRDQISQKRLSKQ
jgi:hypothetical protein